MPDTAIGAPFADYSKSPTRPVIRFMTYPEKLRSIAGQFHRHEREGTKRVALDHLRMALNALAAEAGREATQLFIEETRI